MRGRGAARKRCAARQFRVLRRRDIVSRGGPRTVLYHVVRGAEKEDRESFHLARSKALNVYHLQLRLMG